MASKKTTTVRASISTDPRFATKFSVAFASFDVEAAAERKGRAVALKIAIGDAPSPSKDPVAFVAHMRAVALANAPKATASDANEGESH